MLTFVSEIKKVKIVTQKAFKIAGWTLTIILAAMFIMSALLKLTRNEAAIDQASAFGIDPTTFQFIGIIEVISLILFIIPKTGIIGTLALAAYLGGAIVTHLEHQQSIAMAVTFQMAVWITAFIRFPELKQRIFTTRK